jgi:hypothetical protein
VPKIQWTDLPPALRNHLFERLRERKITAEDLYQLKLWREAEPEAPDYGVIQIGRHEAALGRGIEAGAKVINAGFGVAFFAGTT